MLIGKPAPFVRTFIDAVDQAIRQDHPDSGLSAMQRSWLAFCVTATLVTHSICWARFERASLGTYSMARAGRCRGLCRYRDLLDLKVHVRIPALEDGAQFPVERPHARL